MRHLRHVPALLMVLLVGTMLHYWLPDREIVRIVGTEVKRVDVDSGAPFWDRADIGTNEEATRDVRFINAEKKNGRSMVFRNEDTGWGWPPYLKFDSGDVTAQAQALANQPEQWVAVRHYGWRIKLFSIFPNATSMKKIDGPNTLLIPWFNIVFIGLLLGLWFAVYRLIRNFKEARIDPVADRVGDGIGDAARGVGDSVSAGTRGVQSRWRKIFGSPKPR